MKYELIAPRDKALSSIEQIFQNRGIASQDVYHYLNTTDDDLCSFLSIANLTEGAKMLIRHIMAEDDIFIIVDADCDGYTSSAFLLNYLNYLFPTFTQSHITYDFHKGKTHGIELDIIPPLTKLLIVPDAGSNDIEQQKVLKENGIDILVIDHHQIDFHADYACVINNQDCDYPNKTLSGVGMVYKFCSYLDNLLHTEFAQDLIDLAAVGLIGDMMDIRNYETRHIIDIGLNHIKNPFLKELINTMDFQFKGSVNPHKVSFYIAPFVNAITRVGSQEEKRLIFDAMLNYKAHTLIPSTKRGCKGQQETIVEQAVRVCKNVKTHQDNVKRQGVEIIDGIISEQNLLDRCKVLIVQLAENLGVDKSLTGLVANELASKYQRPTLVLRQTQMENGEPVWMGSGRGYNLPDFRTFIQNSGCSLLAQGHPSAFGCAFAPDKIQDFIDYANEQLKDVDFIVSYKVDLILNDEYPVGETVTSIANLEDVWGQELAKPLVAYENIKVTKENIWLLSRDKKPTIKIKLPNGVELMKFKASEDEFNSLYSEIGFVEINIVGECAINSWMGNITPQVWITEYEIAKKQQYYF